MSRTLPPNSVSRRKLRLILPVLNVVITLFFFGIPHTYYAHVKVMCFYILSAFLLNMMAVSFLANTVADCQTCNRIGKSTSSG